jgi:glycosyltransferase involved in cell wall biosynthesis
MGTETRVPDGGKLRVVTLLDVIGISGGAERIAREVVTRLDPERFDRTLCVSRWPHPVAATRAQAEEMADELRDAGVRFVGLGRRSRWDLSSWGSLVQLLRRERIDVLHAHKFGPNVWAAALGSLARTPVVVAHEHTWSFQGQPMRRFLDRRVIGARADAFLTVSREDRRRMIEIERIDPRKLVYIPNGISTPPPPTGRDVRGELGIPKEAPVVGTVCVLRPQKALDVLVRAAAVLRERCPEVRVLIVGSGEQRAPLERLTAELRLESTVKLLGLRSDVPDVLAALDVAACSSDFEGMPLSVLEYMEAGLPVVATRVGGLPDLIEHGCEGLLVEPRDHVGLAAAVGDLLDDRPRAAELGRRGRERRRSEFDIATTVSRIEDLYEELSATDGARPVRRGDRDQRSSAAPSS